MNCIRHIAPFVLIPLLLVSTIGFSLEIHFCGGEVKSVGLFEAEPCEMENEKLSTEEFAQLPPCHQKMYLANQEKKEKDGFNQDQCCHNEQIIFETEDGEKQISLDPTEVDRVQAVLIYTALDLHLFSTKRAVLGEEDYKPPLPHQDRSVLYQVFRI